MAKRTPAPLAGSNSKAVTEPYLPSNAETAAVKAYAERRKQRPKPPKIKIRESKDDQVTIEPDHPDNIVWAVLMADSFGSVDRHFVDRESSLLLNAVTKGFDVQENTYNAALAAMHGINPSDEIEGMLAAQMIAVHHAAMTMARRLNGAETIDQQSSASNALTKLMRTYTAQIEALNRYRGKGQQKMTVEHVHVHDGGQAIVGNVSKGGGGELEK